MRKAQEETKTRKYDPKGAIRKLRMILSIFIVIIVITFLIVEDENWYLFLLGFFILIYILQYSAKYFGESEMGKTFLYEFEIFYDGLVEVFFPKSK